MIKSIIYPKNGKGYLSEKYEKPEPFDDKRASEYRRGDKEEYERRLAEYEKYGNVYKRPLAAKLLGKRIEFVSDKINIVFGENASGKSTILNSLSNLCNVYNGWSDFIRPMDIMRVRKLGDTVTKDTVKKYLKSTQSNTCRIEWDGAPIYRHNFNERNLRGGRFHGSVKDYIEDAWWLADKSKISSMQGEMVLLAKAFDYMRVKVKFSNIFATFKKGCDIWNDLWEKCYEAQMEYYGEFPMSQSDDLQNTYLFDEFDKHLSIMNAITLYTDVLPKVFRETKQQIILVSHSPIVLSRTVFDTNVYHIVSLDDNYTEECTDRLRKIFY